MGQLRNGSVRGTACEATWRGFPALREEFWNNVNVIGTGEELNQSLEKAGRVADFLEFAELMCLTPWSGMSPAAATSAWRARLRTARPCATTSIFIRVRLGMDGPGGNWELHQEPLEFEYVHLTQRSYK